MKLRERIGKCGRDIDRRSCVQPFGLDQPSTTRRISQSPLEVPYGLRVVVRALPTGSVTPATSSPRSRIPFVTTFGFASIR
jgi:hypothetical protein